MDPNGPQPCPNCKVHALSPRSGRCNWCGWHADDPDGLPTDALAAIKRGLPGVHVVKLDESSSVYEAVGVHADGSIQLRYLNGEHAGRVAPSELRALVRTYENPEED